MIKKLISKILVLILILVMSFVGSTNAYLSDTENSNTNTFAAGSVDLSLRDSEGVVLASSLFNIAGMNPGDSQTKTVKITKDGSLDFQYSVRAVKTAGDDVLCDALKIEAKLDGVSQYNSSLTGLNLNPAAVISGGEDTWDFSVRLESSDAALQEKSCSFNLVVKGWQIGSNGSWGLTDTEILGNSVASGDWTAPAVPLLISPGNNTRLNSSALVQTWQEVFDDPGEDVFYDYQSFNDSSLSSLRWSGAFSNSANGNGSAISKHAEGAPNGSVYWRVKSRDTSGNSSNWSVAWYFTINNSLANPVPEPVPAPPSSGIVLNEILPDPIGLDNAAMPGGEWVELYNKSAATVDVDGWHITDGSGNSLLINGAKTNTGGTSIAPAGFLVVYFGSGSMLNNSGDAVNLYAGSVDVANLVDAHSYGDTPEGKSIARFPDGSATWFDPIPTPNGPNRLEPTLTLDLTGDRHYFSFGIDGISAYKSLDYQVTYDTDGTTQGLQGSISLNNQSEYHHPQTIFGSCSSGGTCVYDSGVKNINLSVTLTGTDGSLLTLEKTIE